MTDQVWSWLAGGIGLIGFWLSGKKVWWCWYVNVVNQVAWAAFALITGYYAFLVTAAFYFAVFSRNAYLWTKDHRVEQSRIDELIGYSKNDAKLTMQLYNAKGENVLDSFPIEIPRLPQQRARDQEGRFVPKEMGVIWKDFFTKKFQMMADHGPVEPVGQYVLRTDFPELYRIIGDKFLGDGRVQEGMFRLPDLRERGVEPKVNHILRLDDRTPICERPNEPDFVTSDFLRNGLECVPCRNTINRWNSMPIDQITGMSVKGEAVLVSDIDMHICHEGLVPPHHNHTLTCPTGEHPAGWQHMPGPHKQCVVCR